MILTDIDLWIGKTLFVPPIVRLCQLTGQSQFAVSRLFWFIAALDGFYRSETLVSSIVFGLMSLFMMLTALSIEFWVFVLIAEYAATIRTIPPRQNKKVASKAAEARSS